VIDHLAPYGETKDAGAPWINRVPEHWEVVRSRYLFREIDRRSATGAETHLSMSQKLGLVPSNQVDQKTLVSESYIGAKLVEPDDLVLNRLKAHLGVFAIANRAGFVSPDYSVFRPADGANVRFFEYVLRSSACRAELRTRAKGIVEGFWRLYTPDFYQIRLPVPPIEERQLIVRFLDTHGALTARLIRAKQRLIKLLEEQKQAIIHRAVTRGLDPNVRLKPSGIAWLGDVPEHWQIRRLKQIARLQSGEGITALDIHEQGEFPVFGGNGLRGYTTACTRDGDYILIGRQGALCGNINYATGRFWASEHAVAVHPKATYVIRWLGELLSVMNLNQYSIAAAQPGLSVERVQRLPIPYPSFDEQQAIVRHIENNTANIERGLACVRDEVALLREFRTRLVADVVTGTLDVRAAAAVLPEITESAPIDEPADGEDLEEAIDDVEDEVIAA